MDAVEIQPGIRLYGREVIRVDYATHGRPVDWARVFGRVAPLELEIGTGSGEFLVRRAREQPECDHVGIEVKNDRVRRFARRIVKEGLGNVVCVHTDFDQVIGCLFPAASLRRIYLLFPDPWPKKRHHKNRALNDATLDVFAALLEPGGTLHLATDDLPYRAWMETHLARHPAFDGPPEVGSTSPFGFPTRYETYWIAERREIAYLSYRRRDGVPAGRFALRVCPPADAAPEAPAEG